MKTAGKLVVLGSINADHILNLDAFPTPGETVTGNHYFFDMIFGGLIVAFSWLIVASLPNGSFVDAFRRLRRHPAAA